MGDMADMFGGAFYDEDRVVVCKFCCSRDVQWELRYGRLILLNTNGSPHDCRDPFKILRDHTKAMRKKMETS